MQQQYPVLHRRSGCDIKDKWRHLERKRLLQDVGSLLPQERKKIKLLKPNKEEKLCIGVEPEHDEQRKPVATARDKIRGVVPRIHSMTPVELETYSRDQWCPDPIAMYTEDMKSVKSQLERRFRPAGPPFHCANRYTANCRFQSNFFVMVEAHQMYCNGGFDDDTDMDDADEVEDQLQDQQSFSDFGPNDVPTDGKYEPDTGQRRSRRHNLGVPRWKYSDEESYKTVQAVTSGDGSIRTIKGLKGDDKSFMPEPNSAGNIPVASTTAVVSKDRNYWILSPHGEELEPDGVPLEVFCDIYGNSSLRFFSMTLYSVCMPSLCMLVLQGKLKCSSIMTCVFFSVM